MKSSMSTWMRVGVMLNHLELPEELTPQPSLILRIPAAASPRLRSILLGAMSSALLQPLAPPYLLTGAPQHHQGRRMEPETTLCLGLPLRTQARHCHLCPHSRPYPQLQLSLPTNSTSISHKSSPFPHLSVPMCKRKGLDCNP